MRKLAIFAENLSGGGVEKVLQNVLKHWDYSEYDLVLYKVRDIPIPDCLLGLPFQQRSVFGSCEGSWLKRIGVRIKNKIKLWIYYHFSPDIFYRLFIRDRFDVAIAFIEGYATRIVSGAPDTVKRLAWLHCDIINHHWTQIAYKSDEEEKKSYHSFDTVVCVSSGVQSQLKLLYGEDIRTRVVMNTIDRDDILTKADLYPVTWNSSSMSAIRIVSLGRLVNVKGYDRLISVIRRLIVDGFDVELFIFGDGREKERLQKVITREGVDGRVHISGYVDNPYPYIKAADVYVCSSYSEGYNTAIAEALVLGTAVVSTDCMKSKDLLGDSEYGIVTDNNEEGLYQGLIKIMEPSVLDYYSGQAAKKGLSFGVNSSVTEIKAIIEGV